MRRSAAAVVVLAACSFAAPDAHAQAAHDATAADVLFEQGRTALVRGDVAVACDKFEESRKLDPAAGTLLNVGSCRENLGDRRSAWLAFREALRAMSPSDDRRSFAIERVAALEGMLARVTMRWAATAPSQALVLLQGEAISPPYDAARVVEPGSIAVVVRAPGHLDRSIARAVRSGEIADIVLSTGDRDDAPPTGAPDAPAARGLGTWPLALGIGGGALLATGGAFGISALRLSARASERCDAALRCSEDAFPLAKDDANAAEAHATVSTVLLATGAVALAAAIVLQLTSGRPPSTKASTATMTTTTTAASAMARTWTGGLSW